MRLLLLHGFAGAGASWRGFGECLPTHAEVLAPDLFGHGPSMGAAAIGPTRTPDAWSFTKEVARIALLLTTKGHADGQKGGQKGDEVDGAWHVVGYSLGARIALGLAHHFSERVEDRVALRSVTLVGAHPGLADRAEREARCEGDEQWAALIEQKGVGNFLEAWRALPVFSSQRSLPQAVLDEQAAVNLEHDASQLAMAMRTLSLGRMPCFRDSLSSLAVETCWIAGSLDEKFSGLGQTCARRSRGRFVSVERVGHNVLLEAPGELARVVLRRENSVGE